MKLSKISTLQKYLSIGGLFYTAIITVALFTNIRHFRSSSVELARIQAEAFFQKDMQYRAWASMHGGVYVPVTEQTPPNPFLHNDERDIVTPSGKKLTLMNPAYMTRQVYDLARDSNGIIGHLTSLTPVRKENAPDAWERNALERLERGEREILSMEMMNGKEYFRYIKPFVTARSCLQCHASQGYAEGDIRGAISVSVPRETIQELAADDIVTHAITLGIFWLTGIGGLIVMAVFLQREVNTRIQSEKRFRAIVEFSPDCIYIVDSEGRLFDANEAFYRHLDYSKEECLNMRISQWDTQWTDKGLFRDLGVLHMNAKTFETQHVAKNGTVTVMEVSAVVVPIGSKHYVYCNAREITQRKLAEEKVRRSEQLFRQIWEQSADGMRLVESNGIITKVNDAYCRMVGKNRDDLEGRPLSVLFPPEREAEVMQKHRDDFSLHRLSQNLEKEVELWNGKKLWLLVSSSYVLTEGNQLQLFGMFRDITERKKTENELKSYNGLLTSMLENLPFDFWARDVNGEGIVQSNEGKRLWGDLNTNTLPGQNVDEEATLVRCENNEKAMRGETVRARRMYRSRDTGDWRTYYEIVAPYYSDNTIAGILGINVDLTDQQITEEQLAIRSHALESAANGIVITDPDGTIEWVNPAFEALTGYGLSEAKGKNPRDLVKSDHHTPEFYAEMWRTISSGRHWTGEFVNKRKDGTTYNEEQTITPVFDKRGKIIRYIGIKQDITEWKKAQKEIRIGEERVRALFEQSAVGMVLCDLTGRFVRVNKKFCDITGYSEMELLQRRGNDITHPSDRAEEDANLRLLFASVQDSYTMEKRYQRKDGGNVWVNISVTMIRDAANAPGMLSGVVEDISEKKSVEHAVQQLAVFSGELEQHAIFDMLTRKLAEIEKADFSFIGILTPDAAAVRTIAAYRDGKMIENFEYVLAGTPCEHALKQGLAVYPQGVAAQFPGDKMLALLGIDSYMGISLIDSKGEVRGVLVTLGRTSLRTGKEYQSIHTLFAQRAMNEIERMQSEQELREKENEFRLLVENVQDVFVRINNRGIMTYCSPSIGMLGGYKPEEEVGCSISKYFTDRDQLLAAFRGARRAYTTGTTEPVEFLFRTADGRAIWVEAIGRPARTETGATEIFVTIRDIHKRKQAEELVRTNEEMLRNVQSISNIGSYRLDIRTGRWSSSDALDRILGIEHRKESSVEEWMSFIHPDWQAMMSKYFTEYVIGCRNRFDREYKIINQTTHQERWVHGQGELQFDAGGTPVAMLGSIQDITERKRMEEALRESEERYRGLIELSMDGFLVIDEQGAIFQVNDSYAQMTGFTVDEIRRRTLFDLEASEFPDQTREHLAAIRTKGHDRFESRHRCKNGSNVHVEVNMVFLSHQRVFLCFVNNITMRKKTESSLRESERRFRGIIENVDLAGLMLDTSAHIMLANDYLLRLTGWEREDLEGKDWIDTFIPEEQRELVQNVFDRAVHSGKLEIRFENEVLTRSGERRMISWNNMFLYDNDDMIIGLTCLGEDITARKETEEALLEREEQYRTLVTTMHQGLALHEAVYDENGKVCNYRFIDINDSYEKLTGLQREALIGRMVLDVLPGTEEYWIEQYDAVVKTGEPLFFENYSAEFGKYFEVVAYRPKPDHFATIITDVTARKLADLHVKASERQYRLLAENSSDVIWTMDLNLKMTYVSPSIFQLRGYTPEEVLAQSLDELLCPASKERVLAEYKVAIENIRNGVEIAPVLFTVEQPCKKGTTVWTEVLVRVMYDDKKRALGLLGVTRNITDRKRREDLLHARLNLSEYANEHTTAELQREILDAAEKLTDSTAGFFCTLGDDQHSCSLQSLSTNAQRHITGGEGNSWTYDRPAPEADCIATKQPLIRNHIPVPSGPIPCHRDLIVPILRNDRIVAALRVANKRIPYDQNDVEIVSQLATMAWDILERRRAELSLQEHERALAGLSKAAVALLHMSEWNSDRTIQKALESLGEGLDGDRVYIFENEQEDMQQPLCCSMRYEWTKTGISKELQNPSMHSLPIATIAPAMFGSLRAGRTYKHVTAELPAAEREILEAQDVKSLILVPIFIDELFWGFIGVDSVRMIRRWSSDVESILHVAAESFGLALQRLKAVSQLFESEQMLKFALEASGDGIWTLNVPAMEPYFSPEAKQLAGYTEEEFPNDFNSWFTKVHPEDQQSVIEAMQQHIRGEAPFFVSEHRMLCKDGEYRWMLDRGKVLKWNTDGTPLQIFGTYADIHRRKQTEETIVELNEQLEQKVEDRTRQLRDSIQELESFSYSISHDLRAPVRAIDSFTKILADEEEQMLTDEGKRLLKTIRTNTARMGRMIDDLLQFSRASRAEIKKVSFDMDAMAAKVLEEAIGGERTRLFTARIEPLPQAYGDPSLLRQVLVNLVNNAVKFTRGRDESVIRIGGTSAGGMNTFWIRDNGTGFDMQYVDKLFGVFQRLHSQQEFEGTGVGLAIVNRIVQKHGGKVWVESQVGIGTTFYFSIPHGS